MVKVLPKLDHDISYMVSQVTIELGFFQQFFKKIFQFVYVTDKKNGDFKRDRVTFMKRSL